MLNGAALEADGVLASTLAAKAVKQVRYDPGKVIISGDNANIPQRVETISMRLVEEVDGQSPDVVERVAIGAGKETNQNMKFLFGASKMMEMVVKRHRLGMESFNCGDWMYHVKCLNHVAPHTPLCF